MDYLLSTNCLTKQFKEHKAVNEVSLHLKQGDIYGFIGRNGAGKTTFLKMISGLSEPTSGEITLFNYKGKEIRNVLSRIGTLIEAPGIYPSLNAYENLKLKCICAGIKKQGYIEDLLKIVGLSDVGKKKAGDFSLGMKQRLGIAMALVGEPDLLVLDEPINGLDPQGIVEVRDTILRLNKEKNITIIISSHILEELSKLATMYGIIDDGVLIRELSKEDLLKQCREHIEIVLEHPESACTVLDGMGITDYKVIDKQTIHVFEQLDKSADINFALAEKKIMVNSIRVENEALEDYFIGLTGGAKNV